MCLPSQKDTSVWKIWNSSSYCSNKVIYSCVSDNTAVINWDISEQGTLIASSTVSHVTNDGRLIRESEPIEAVLEVTYSNLTFIASTIILILSMDPQTVTVACNSIILENIPRTSVKSKSSFNKLLNISTRIFVLYCSGTNMQNNCFFHKIYSYLVSHYAGRRVNLYYYY